MTTWADKFNPHRPMTNKELIDGTKPIETDYQDEIVCPHCGYRHRDSWEVNSDDTNLECEDCGKEFLMTRVTEVYYTTKKV